MSVEAIVAIQDRLDTAEDLAAACLAGWDAFELIQDVAAWCADLASASFATWMTVAGPACAGSYALGVAPSLPLVHRRAIVPGSVEAAAEDDVADELAILAAVLGRRLLNAAQSAADPGDGRACQLAAQAAEEIRELLVRGG
jgi:hypothetical protein